MTQILTAFGWFAAIAAVLGIILAAASKIFFVKTDERIEKIKECLPGANCGGCGHSGCEGFAQCLACGKASLDDCKVTSDEEKKIIAKIAGIEFAASEPTVAVVKCAGGDGATDRYEYVGNDGCLYLNQYLGGSKICATACLGGGSCTEVCPVDAIKLENGVAKVDKTLCISCGACMRGCPRSVIERIPASAKVYCACSTRCKGKETMSFCDKGCIGCGLCARVCPEKAITMKDNLPVFDYSKCVGCMKCLEKCPRHIIRQM